MTKRNSKTGDNTPRATPKGGRRQPWKPGQSGRLKRLEQRRPGANLPRIIPFPTDGMTEQEIQEKLAREDERGEVTIEEWVAEYCGPSLTEGTPNGEMSDKRCYTV
jgi:hypothetical protein